MNPGTKPPLQRKVHVLPNDSHILQDRAIKRHAHRNCSCSYFAGNLGGAGTTSGTRALCSPASPTSMCRTMRPCATRPGPRCTSLMPKCPILLCRVLIQFCRVARSFSVGGRPDASLQQPFAAAPADRYYSGCLSRCEDPYLDHLAGFHPSTACSPCAVQLTQAMVNSCCQLDQFIANCAAGAAHGGHGELVLTS